MKKPIKIKDLKLTIASMRQDNVALVERINSLVKEREVLQQKVEGSHAYGFAMTVIAAVAVVILFLVMLTSSAKSQDKEKVKRDSTTLLISLDSIHVRIKTIDKQIDEVVKQRDLALQYIEFAKGRLPELYAMKNTLIAIENDSTIRATSPRQRPVSK